MYEERQLHDMAKIGKVEKIINLLAGGANPNELDSEDRKPIYYACMNGHAEAFNILLDCTEVSETDEDELEKLALLYENIGNTTQKRKYQTILLLIQNVHTYDYLWRSDNKAISEKIIDVFEDYYAPLILKNIGLPVIQRILTGHWNRSNLDLAESICTLFKAKQRISREIKASVIQNELRDLAERLMNDSNKKPLGSFARRLEYIQRKLLLQSEKIKFLPDKWYNQITEHYFKPQPEEIESNDKEEYSRLSPEEKLSEKSQNYEDEVFTQRLDAKDKQIEAAVAEKERLQQEVEKLKEELEETKRKSIDLQKRKGTSSNLAESMLKGINSGTNHSIPPTNGGTNVPDFDELSSRFDTLKKKDDKKDDEDELNNSSKCAIM